jgi:hypothetical protein
MQAFPGSARSLATATALDVSIVDGSGSQITTFGGGTQYTEDAAAAADPVGNASILVRQDTPAALTTTDGDNVARRGTNYGAAYTQIVSSTGSFVDTFGGGTQYTEGDTDATITGTAMLMEGAANTLLTVPGTTADGLLVNLGGNNDVTVTGSVAVTNAALGVVGGGVEATALRVTVASDSTGVLSVDDNGGSITVDGTVAVTNAALGVVGSGTEATAMRVTIATDSTGVLSVDDNGGSITVDGTVAVSGSVDTELSAAAALADNTANPTVTSVGAFPHWYDGATWDRAAGNSTDGLKVNLGADNDVTVTGSVAVTNAALGVVGGGVEATALRVTIASDSTGVVSVDDNGGSITVDGTVSITGAVDTELPAAASLTDNFANPTTTNVAAMGMVWDGVTWDRAAGTSADGALVNLGANNDVTVTSGAITETNSAAIAASLSVLDDWDESDRAKVNVIVGQAGIAAGTGVDGATVPRVTLATNVGLPAGTSVIGKVGHDITGIGHGVATVTTAGTDVALAGSTSCKRVVIQAQTDNTTGIAVGGSGVDATIATGTGIFLNPGDAFELETDNLADVFVDSLTNGEGVRYTYFT